MKKLMMALGVATALAAGAAGCSARASVGWETPGYYEARGYPTRVVAPGVRAYYIKNDWYVHRGGTWVPYRQYVRGQGRVIIR
jgi:hypothetical protein